MVSVIAYLQGAIVDHYAIMVKVRYWKTIHGFVQQIYRFIMGHSVGFAHKVFEAY